LEEGPPPYIEDWLRRYRLRRFGSTALHLCYVAMGALDVVHDHRSTLWDVAGAAPIVLEAGAVLTQADRSPLFPGAAARTPGPPPARRRRGPRWGRPPALRPRSPGPNPPPRWKGGLPPR